MNRANTRLHGVIHKLDDLINPARSLAENNLMPIQVVERGGLLTLHAGYAEDFIYDSGLPTIQITPHAPHEVVKYRAGVDVASGGVMRVGEDTIQNIVMFLVDYLGVENKYLEGGWNWGEEYYDEANKLDDENFMLKRRVAELEVIVDGLEYELEQVEFYAENPEDKPYP